jgi:hypothetical protein
MPETDLNWNRADIPILKHVEYTPADADLDDFPKAILLDADGTIDYTAMDGTVCAGVPLAGNVMHRISPKRITACTANLWLCY